MSTTRRLARLAGLARLACLASAGCSSARSPGDAAPVTTLVATPASAGSAAVAPPVAAVAAVPADAGAAPPGEIDGGPGVLPAAALAGPFARLDDYCKRDWKMDSGERGRCQQGGPYGREIARSSGVIRAARLFVIHYPSWAGVPASFCRLALRTERGWFVDDPGAEPESPCEGPDGSGGTRRIASETLAWSDDGAAVLVVTRLDRASNGWWRGLTICGVGPSGAPSCAQGGAVGCPSWRSSRADGSWDPVAVRWRYTPGLLEIDGDSCWTEPDRAMRVVFP